MPRDKKTRSSKREETIIPTTMTLDSLLARVREGTREIAESSISRHSEKRDQEPRRREPARQAQPRVSQAAARQNNNNQRSGVKLCSKSNPCGNQNSCNCCGPFIWTNPAFDVDQLPCQIRTKNLTELFGFDGIVAGATTTALVPFIPSWIPGCPNKLQLAVNSPAFTQADLQDALGFSAAQFVWPQYVRVVLADLPGTYAEFNGLYQLCAPACAPFTAPYTLMRINWSEDCIAPDVGDWVQIKFGSSAGVYRILTLDQCTQRWTLELIASYLFCAVLVSMCAPGTKYKYFDQLPPKTECCNRCHKDPCGCGNYSDDGSDYDSDD